MTYDDRQAALAKAVKAGVKEVYLDRMRESLVQNLRSRAKIVQSY